MTLELKSKHLIDPFREKILELILNRLLRHASLNGDAETGERVARVLVRATHQLSPRVRVNR